MVSSMGPEGVQHFLGSYFFKREGVHLLYPYRYPDNVRVYSRGPDTLPPPPQDPRMANILDQDQTALIRDHIVCFNSNYDLD